MMINIMLDVNKKRCQQRVRVNCSIMKLFMLLSVLCFQWMDCWGATTVAKNKDKQGTTTSSSAAGSSTASSSSSSSKPLPRRERNLDHWDADTLAFYLDIDPKTGEPLGPRDNTSSWTAGSAAVSSTAYPGYDIAIMFYASWCRNCHALAPYWDRIATFIKAGSTQSKIIMALFDCERNKQHEKLCTAASVTHYPTLLFVGAGPYHDTDPITSLFMGKKHAAGPAGPTTIPNAVKFQGNWKYADSILDWIRTMQLLSRWHVTSSQGWLRFLRHGLLGAIFPPFRNKHRRATSASLPVGLPLGGTGGGGGGGGSGQSNAQVVSALEKKIKDMETKNKDYAKLVLRSSAVVDALLFPVGQPSQVVTKQSNLTTATTTGIRTNTSNTTSTHAYTSDNFTDVFTLLHEKNGWNMSVKSSKSDPITYVMLSCALDVILDVCHRVNTHVTTDFARNYPEDDDDIYRNYTKLDHLLNTMVDQREPYCGIVDNCILKNFEPAPCQPPTCPFVDPVACRYLTACLTKPIQTEYAVALEIIREGETFPPPPPSKTKEMLTDKKKMDDKKPGGAWGVH